MSDVAESGSVIVSRADDLPASLLAHRRRRMSMLIAFMAIARIASGQGQPVTTQPYFEFQVEKQAKQLSPSTLKYPDFLRSAAMEGEVLAQFVVSDSGTVVPGTFKVIKSSHQLFSQSVRQMLDSTRFAPAEVRGRKVAQLVQQPFHFSITSSDGSGENVLRPNVVAFGTSLAEMQLKLRNLCTSLNVRRIDPPFKVLSDIKDRQFQVDCEGFRYAGKPRHAEFVIADDALEMVWIMTSKEDAAGIVRAMSATYGESDVSNDKFYAFTRGRSAIRIDVPEVLFYSPRLAPRVLGWFGPNSTF